MADEPIASAAPASAPSAPVSAPAAPSAPSAPAVSAPTAPATPAITHGSEPALDGLAEAPAPNPSGTSAPNPGETPQEYLTRVQMEKLNPPAPTDAEKPADEVTPHEGGELPKTEDAVEPVKPTEEKPTEDPKPAVADNPDDELTLEPDNILATSDLAKKINTPEARSALEALGINPDSMFATARVAAKGAKVLEAFDGDVQAAFTAKEQAEQFGTLSEKFAGQTTLEDTNGLLGELMKFSYQYDDDGNVVMVDRGDGQMIPKGDGTVGRFIDNTFQIGLKYWSDKAEASGNPDIKAVCEVLQEEYQRLTGSAQAKDYSNLDESTRARLEAVDAREKEQANREAAEQTRQSQAFELKIATSIDSGIDDAANSLLKNATLTDGQKQWALDQIKERVTDALATKKLFFNKRDTLARRPMSEKTQRERVTHGLNSARPLLPKIVNAVLADLGIQIQDQKQAVTDKVATQTQASRSEVKSATQPAAPQSLTPSALVEMAKSELLADGKNPDRTELVFQKISEIKKRIGTR